MFRTAPTAACRGPRRNNRLAAKVSSPRSGPQPMFALSVALVVVASIGFAAWLTFRIGGDQLTTGVERRAAGPRAPIHRPPAPSLTVSGAS